VTLRLLLLCTGGTIGMAPGPHGLAPAPSFPDTLRAFVGDRAAADVQALGEPIDSANATPHDWLRIARALVERWDEHDAFIVLHGTDTLAYTASALAFMLGRGIDKPVLVTGAQRPWCAADSDGPANVRLAIDGAHTRRRGVAVAFGGRLLHGARATKASSVLDAAFDSPNAPCIAVEPGVARDDEPLEAFAPRLPLPIEAGVAVVHCLPGLSARHLQVLLDTRPAALLLCCFGGATLPSLDGAMDALLHQARAHGIALAAISQVRHGGLRPGAYAAGHLLTKHGVADGRDMTLEAAYTKLHHLAALRRPIAEIEASFARSLVGELSAGVPGTI